MKGPTKAALVGMEVVGVACLQAVAMFVAYGHQLIALFALSIPAALALQVILFSQSLRPVAAVTCAILFTLAGAYVGAFFAFNRYGT